MIPLPEHKLAVFLRKNSHSLIGHKIVTRNNHVFTIVDVTPYGIKAIKLPEDVLEELNARWN